MEGWKRQELFGYSFVFFFNDTATTEIYTLSLHDALPISGVGHVRVRGANHTRFLPVNLWHDFWWRSEEHTSELQSPCNLVCRLLLEKKKVTQSVRRCRSRSLSTSSSGHIQAVVFGISG